MRELLLRCPNCRAPLTPPGRFANSMACAHCGAHVTLVEEGVSSAPYLAALARWNAPPAGHPTVHFAGTHWFLGGRIAQGTHTDVHIAARARQPTQLGVLHLARDARGDEVLGRAAATLRSLRVPSRPGMTLLADRTSTLLFEGRVISGKGEGRMATASVWRPGFRYTLRDVRERLQRTLDAHQAIWLFRRLCEVLGALHRGEVVHGAVFPEHVLVEDGEHGARLLGFGSAGAAGTPLPPLSERAREFGIDVMARSAELQPALDLGLAARTLIFGLGGDPTRCSVPAAVPAPLADFFQRVSRGASSDARALREEAGQLGTQLFGRPRFAPLVTAKDVDGL